MDFSSIKNATLYLKSLGLKANRNKIAQILDTKEAYNGYTF